MRRIAVLLSASLLSSGASAQGWLDVARELVSNTEAHSVRIRGDADGDGDLDLIRYQMSLGLPAAFEVLLNDGAGQFSPGSTTALTPPGYPYGPPPLFGDLTGDGIGDVILAHIVDERIRIFPGLGGAQYGASLAIDFPAVHIGPSMEAMVLGDATGDGQLDLAVSHRDGPDGVLGWWTWNGSAFVASAQIVSTGPTLLTYLAPIDLDQDGSTDLIAGQDQSSLVTLLPTVAGAPTLGPSIDVPMTLGSPSYGRIPVVGDLEGDGDEDLLVFHEDPFGFEFASFLNQGGGSFALAFQLAVPDQVSTFLRHYLGDWDGDGDLDLLVDMATVPKGTGIHAFENNGSGRFELKAVMRTLVGTLGPGPADFDGDGRLDFCSERTLQFGNGLFRDSLTIPSSSLLQSPRNVAVDWEGDGDLDLATPGNVLVNDGTGALTISFEMPLAPPGFGYTKVFATGDFDGDGRFDWLAGFGPLVPPFFFPSFAETRLILDGGFGNYVDVGAAAPSGVAIAPFLPQGFDPIEFYPVPAIDLEPDGDVDVLAAGGYWPNSGTGAFGSFVPLAFAGRPAVAADLEGDGDLDLLSYDAGSSQVLVGRNGGSLAFSNELVVAAPSLHPVPRFADLDADGDLDVAAGTVAPTGKLYLVENAGGAFQPAVELATASLRGQGVVADDFDGDGLADLLVGPAENDLSNGLNTIYLYRRSGAAFAAYESPRAYLGQEIHAAVDIDEDGDLDGVGDSVMRNGRFTGLDAGFVRQYGAGSLGSGGAVPVLGASGPMRTGSASAALHLRRAVGGTASLLAISAAEAELPGFPFPGLTAWVDPTVLVPLIAVAVGGPAGGSGLGGFDVPLTISAGLVGQTFFAQSFALDLGAPALFAASNGLEIHVGL